MNEISKPLKCHGEGKQDSKKDHLLSLPAPDSSNPHLITALINTLTSENKVNLISCLPSGRSEE